MSESYVIGYTLFPKGYGTFKTRFQVFTDKKYAINYYKSLKTDNKKFYISIEDEEVEELLKE